MGFGNLHWKVGWFYLYNVWSLSVSLKVTRDSVTLRSIISVISKRCCITGAFVHTNEVYMLIRYWKITESNGQYTNTIYQPIRAKDEKLTDMKGFKDVLIADKCGNQSLSISGISTTNRCRILWEWEGGENSPNIGILWVRTKYGRNRGSLRFISYNVAISH